jgi:hypothetical protein
MKRSETPSDSIPRHDYGLALKSAVSWLGDRYLLATPLNRRRDDRRDYFTQARSWIDVRNVKRPAAVSGGAR